MAPIDSTTNDIPSDDELDEILRGTANGEDIFDTSNNQVIEAPPNHRKPTGDVADLGIDKEIETKKKQRQPIPKLDENRLLSEAGVPKLRKISKERLKFKGKGHEYGDIARMLNMYQLWLDDLYPRAKFADGLAMIEKLGHSKRIQMMRKEWIDEGKPRHSTEQSEENMDIVEPDQIVQENAEQIEGLEGDGTTQEQRKRQEPREQTSNGPEEGVNARQAEEPDEDDLDALLAENAISNIPVTSAALPSRTVSAADDDPFADEMEVMAEIGADW